MTQERTLPTGRPLPSLYEIAVTFMLISLQSFGGGTTSWIRRSVVQRRGWLQEQQFLGGLALAQITPGANSVNLAVYVGTTLRGRVGALAALAGILLLPTILVLIAGAVFGQFQDVPAVESAMAGIGAAAVGLTIANGLDLSVRALRNPGAMLVTAVTTIAVGVFDLSLVPVLVVMVPISLLLARRRR